MNTIQIKTSHPYEARVGQGLIKNIAREISDIKKPGKCIIVSDDVVFSLYGEAVKASLIDAGYSVYEAVFAHGEDSKNIETALSLLTAFFEAGLTRSDFAIALGGGVVGDVCGFVSSIYLRGIDFIQIPTTVLAAIDSSVGGKTGVNTDYGKNLVGAFHQPVRVICDTDTFETLPYDIYTAGICEALKYGVIRDRDLFDSIVNADTNLENVVCRCVQIKADIVEKDEFDHGERQLLNFGHTLGHSIEALSNFEISHGHAVCLGMLIISRAAEAGGLCEVGVSENIEKALKSFEIDTDIQYSYKELSSHAMTDKKRKGNEITLVIPKKLGECVLHTISTEKLEEFISL